MDDLDLDSFIANIEQTAPEEATDDPSKPKCQECDILLEDVDGVYTCPNCSAQADILQVEETELHYDENGRLCFGQGVKLVGRRKKHVVDYGWTWSTDEAIVHILNMQVAALEEAELVTEFFRKGLSNIWLKFWSEYIAPFIRDDYSQEDLVSMQVSKALKLRDIEVLVKVQDKVMVPSYNVDKKLMKFRGYRLLGTRFVRENSPGADCSSSESLEAVDTNMKDANMEDVQGADNSTISDHMDVDETGVAEDLMQDSTDVAQELGVDHGSGRAKNLTRSLGRESVTILTLNRTLAFLLATASCLKSRDPLFASDLIRAANCRLIPFYGVHKHLPEGLKLDRKDRLMFQKDRQPSAEKLTRAASLLIHQVYHDKIPFYTPVPSLKCVLTRFVSDLNLPYDLIRHLVIKAGFHALKQTKSVKFDNARKVRYFPQYDRWAFAILICQMKRVFGLTSADIRLQADMAHREAKRSGQDMFILEEWIRHISLKLKLIMTYDPYVLYHPMVSMKDLKTTPQLCKYIELLITERPRATTRTRPIEPWRDIETRVEISEFLRRELPRPSEVDIVPDEELDRTTDLRHPISEAFKRTKRLWLPKLREQESIIDLLSRDFSCTKPILPPGIERWELSSRESLKSMKFEIQPEWPYSYKLLLSLAGYVCHCEPRELLREIRVIEFHLYEKPKQPKKRKRTRTKR